MTGAAHGWAIIKLPDGEIDVRTVSPTRRAAIVNYLVLVPRIMITAAHSDSAIETLWKQFHTDHAAVEVTIMTTADLALGMAAP